MSIDDHDPLLELRETDPEEERRHYKVVRRDTFQDVPGTLILSANIATGMCVMRDAAGERKEYNFGPGSIIIVTRR